MAVAIDAAKIQAAGSAWEGLMTSCRIWSSSGAIAGLSSVMVVMMLGQPRIFYSMAKDGLLPAWAKQLHPKFRTPHITTILTGVLVSIAAGFTPINILGELVSIGTLHGVRHRLDRDSGTAYEAARLEAAVLGAARVGRGAGFGAGVARSDGRAAKETWERLVIWMVIGIVLYFAYGYRHSVLRHPEKAA